MAALEDLRQGYHDSAVKLTIAIEELKPVAEAGDKVAQEKLRIMHQMLQEMRDLRHLVANYYTAPRSPLYTMDGMYAPKTRSDK